jgi:hypothetical protein
MLRSFAELRTLTIAQRMIQDNGRWRVFLYGNECPCKGLRRHYSRTRV